MVGRFFNDCHFPENAALFFVSTQRAFDQIISCWLVKRFKVPLPTCCDLDSHFVFMAISTRLLPAYLWFIYNIGIFFLGAFANYTICTSLKVEFHSSTWDLISCLEIGRKKYGGSCDNFQINNSSWNIKFVIQLICRL